jgi:pseudouridine-5'-phosphate glycosidase
MLEFSPRVLEALNNESPVVALESTIYTHGLPYPENLKLAREVEKIIEDAGAIPATIAIIDGVLKVGVTDSELKYLVQNDSVIKASKRDFAYLMATGGSGGTTVSGTLIVAAMAGIKVFATGGIGGVHRGYAETLDISRDLEELSEQSVAVVASGVKSILDIKNTLEYLETKGVEVLGYQTKDFPAFYTSKSGFKVDFEAESALMVASIMHAKFDSGLKGGILIANPVPKEDALDEKTMHKAIDKALKKAKEKGIKGKEITPFLLSEIKAITEGKSLKANIALMKRNAYVAAIIAKEY